MSSIDYSSKIPNNVNLAEDRTLQRALEHWLPNYLDWWGDMGPDGSHGFDVYLRTATSTTPDGWAHFGYTKMPDYRWGIFLEPKQDGRTHGFGDFHGQPVWDEVPGEFRNMLRRLLVTQGDTEHASVEQQRDLGATAPSLYDLRNLFQVNVEEGRHLWAMVYLLHAHFGGTGARRPRSSWSGAPGISTNRGFSPPSTSRSTTGSPSSCSRCSPTATASISCRRCRSRASIRSRAPAGSC